MAHNVMEKFRLSAIAAVDRPAQQGARALIMKRDDTPESPYIAKGDADAALSDAAEAYLKREWSDKERAEAEAAGEAMPGGGYPIRTREDLHNAVEAFGRAKDPEKTKAHIVARARSLDATSMLPDGWQTGKSLDGDLVIAIQKRSPRDLPELLGIVVKAEEVGSEIAKIEDVKARKAAAQEFTIAKTALSAVAWDVVDTASDSDLSSLLRKCCEEFKDHVLGLVPGVLKTTKSGGGDDMGLKEFAKALGLKDDATEAEITKALGEYLALAKMSGKHKAFMENDDAKMPKGGKEAFQSMSPDERDAHMEAHPVGGDAGGDDEEDCKKGIAFQTPEGLVLRKRDFNGSDIQFNFAKAQNQKIIKQAADLAKMADDKAKEGVAKRVTVLKHAGDSSKLTEALHAIAKADPANAAVIEGVIATMDNQLGKSALMNEIGSGMTGRAGNAAQAIQKMAEGLIAKGEKDAKGHVLTIAKARTKVRDENPELKRDEENEAKEARKAA